MAKNDFNIKEFLKAIEEMYTKSDEKTEMEKTLKKLLNKSIKNDKRY